MNILNFLGRFCQYLGYQGLAYVPPKVGNIEDVLGVLPYEVIKYLPHGDFKNLADTCHFIRNDLKEAVVKIVLENLNSIIKQLEQVPNSRYKKQAEQLKKIANKEGDLFPYANFHQKIKAAAEILQTVHKDKLKELETSPGFFPLTQVALSLHNYNHADLLGNRHYEKKHEINTLYALQVWDIAYKYDLFSDDPIYRRIEELISAGEFSKVDNILSVFKGEWPHFYKEIARKSKEYTLIMKDLKSSFSEPSISEKIQQGIKKIYVYRNEVISEEILPECQQEVIKTMLFFKFPFEIISEWVKYLVSVNQYAKYEKFIDTFKIYFPKRIIHEYKVRKMLTEERLTEAKEYCEELNSNTYQALIKKVADRVIQKEGVDECLEWAEQARKVHSNPFLSYLIEACIVLHYAKKNEIEKIEELIVNSKIKCNINKIEDYVVDKLACSNKHQNARTFIKKFSISSKSLENLCYVAVRDFIDKGEYQNAIAWINEVIPGDLQHVATRETLINYINAAENLERLPESTTVN